MLSPFRPVFFLAALLPVLFSCSKNTDHIASTSEPAENAQQEAALLIEAKAIVQQFAGTLKPQLKTALENGGPVNAIRVCAELAPSIAEALSAETGWQVKRVSLKARNNTSAIPDAWESGVLKSFDQRHSKGEAAMDMVEASIVDKEFRFMKAQGVEPLCLVCHGDNIAPEVQSTLHTLYPQDRATGYQLGDIRGAFSLRKKLD